MQLKNHFFKFCHWSKLSDLGSITIRNNLGGMTVWNNTIFRFFWLVTHFLMTQFSLDQCSVFQISSSILTTMIYLVFVRRVSNDTWWKLVKFSLFGYTCTDLLVDDLVWSGHLHRDGADLVESLNLLCQLSLWILSIFFFSKFLYYLTFLFHLLTS